MITFVRALDKGVRKAIGHQDAPLVLACTDHLFNIYKSTSRYALIYNLNLSGDPEFKGKTHLHQASWAVIAPYFTKTQVAKLEQFHEQSHTAKTSSITDDIIKAAFNGKVDTLFVTEGTRVFGSYTSKNQKVIVDDQREPGNISLINLAALETYKQGGNVYFLPTDAMPVKESPLNALFRY